MASMNFDYLPFTADEVPVKKTFSIGTVSYKFEIKYNDRYDYYMCYIYDIDDNLLYSAKLVLFGKLIHAVVDGLDVPYDLLSMNLDQFFTNYMIDTKVDSLNFGDTVQVYINNPVLS
jgi:hypothetical protein